MSLNLCYGPASADHEQVLLTKATTWLKEKDQQVFYIVPNHIKFETEVNVLKSLAHLSGQRSVMNLQVFSFSRLAWYFLQNNPVYQKKTLTTIGKQMIVRTILKDEQEHLKVYRGEINRQGFIEQLVAFFEEMIQGNIFEEELNLLVNNLSNDQSDLKEKLEDLKLIYHKYQSFLTNEALADDQILIDLVNELSLKDLKQTMFIVKGFSRFTAQEQQLIELLMQRSGELVVDLVLDKAYTDQSPEKHDLFYYTGKLYFDLYQLAKKNHVPLLFDSVLSSEPIILSELDTYWRESQKYHTSNKMPAETELAQQLKVWEAQDPQAEVEHVAKEIRRLIASGKYRYSEIEILLRDEMTYYSRIAPVFAKHAIPYYLDEEQTMKHHPLMELLEALFSIDKRYYRYPDIMRFLRSELFIPNDDLDEEKTENWLQKRANYREAVDVTENVMLAYGYEGSYWTKSKDWQYVNYIQSEDDEVSRDAQIEKTSNEIRRHVRNVLVPFYQEINEASNGKEAASSLYHFLVQIGVERQLLKWRNAYIEQGELEKAKIHEQSWQAFVQLLDEYVAIFGDSSFNKQEFEDILLYGLENTTYSKVPTTLDQVKVSLIDKVHAKKNKVTFIIGLTENCLPQKAENISLLADDERQVIEENLSSHQYLLPTGSQAIINEPFIAYLAFLSTSDKLYLTYPLGGEKGVAAKVSPYVTRLVKNLGISIQTKSLMPTSDVFDSEFIGTYETLVEMLVRLKRQSMDQYITLAAEWLALERLLYKEADTTTTQQAKKVFESLTHKNIPEKLTKPTIEALYGQTLYGSVSRIEKFHQCEYKYFMTYGLKLKERELFDLTPATAGELFHEALDVIFKELIEMNKMLSDLSEKQVEELAEKVLTKVFSESKYLILSTTQRMNYVKYQLSQTIKRVSWALKKQSIRTGFSILKTEVLFGEIAKEKGLTSLTVAIDEYHQMKISGKIDRVDYLKLPQEEVGYMNVVDYKSSQHSFSYEDAYAGLAMQMLTYLDVALLNAVELVGNKEAKIGGAFYLHVKNPRIKGPISVDHLEEKILSEYKYKGLIVEDDQLINQLDKTLLPKETSAMFDLYQKADETISSKQLVKEQELNQLLKHNRHNFKEAGQKIYQGDVHLNPAFRKNKRIACAFCPFRSICQFDPMLAENNYKKLEELKKQDVLNLIEKEEEAHD